MLTSLSLMIVGPKLAEWLSGGVQVSPLWVLLWPYVHWTIVVGLVAKKKTPKKSAKATLAEVIKEMAKERVAMSARGGL